MLSICIAIVITINALQYVLLIQNSPAVQKCAAPKKAIVKRCEIQGGSQEMTVQ